MEPRPIVKDLIYFADKDKARKKFFCVCNIFFVEYSKLTELQTKPCVESEVYRPSRLAACWSVRNWTEFELFGCRCKESRGFESFCHFSGISNLHYEMALKLIDLGLHSDTREPCQNELFGDAGASIFIP